MRGHAGEYDYWRQIECEGWDYEGVLPFYKKEENCERGE